MICQSILKAGLSSLSFQMISLSDHHVKCLVKIVIKCKYTIRRKKSATHMIHVGLVGCRPLFKVQVFVGKNVTVLTQD